MDIHPDENPHHLDPALVAALAKATGFRVIDSAKSLDGSFRDDGLMLDTTWGNDVCASVELYRSVRIDDHVYDGVRVWCDAKAPEAREHPERTRFMAILIDGGEPCGPILVETDDIDAVASKVQEVLNAR